MGRLLQGVLGGILGVSIMAQLGMWECRKRVT